MRRHNIWCVYMRSVWRGMPDCSPAYLSKQSACTHELPEDDLNEIETCLSIFKRCNMNILD